MSQPGKGEIPTQIPLNSQSTEGEQAGQTQEQQGDRHKPQSQGEQEAPAESGRQVQMGAIFNKDQRRSDDHK